MSEYNNMTCDSGAMDGGWWDGNAITMCGITTVIDGSGAWAIAAQWAAGHQHEWQRNCDGRRQQWWMALLSQWEAMAAAVAVTVAVAGTVRWAAGATWTVAQWTLPVDCWYPVCQNWFALVTGRCMAWTPYYSAGSRCILLFKCTLLVYMAQKTPKSNIFRVFTISYFIYI